MILQSPILALLLADLLSLLLLFPASLFALQILRHWDPASGRALQLRLEKKTYLITSVLGLVFLVQLLALPLFVHTVDRLALQIAGAMCAVGTLGANPWGFPALLWRIGLFFLAAAWLILHHLDQQAADSPLIRLKYALLLLILPVCGLATATQWLFFQQLNPDVITSCCGSLFRPEGDSVPAHMAGLPVTPVKVALYSTLGLALVTAGVYLRWRRGLLGFGMLTLLSFPVGIAAIITFLSLYVYEHPLHHCPFCLLQADYGHIGYALYLPLFTASGLGCGLTLAILANRFSHHQSLPAVLEKRAPALVLLAATGLAMFTLLVLWISWRSPLVLPG